MQKSDMNDYFRALTEQYIANGQVRTIVDLTEDDVFEHDISADILLENLFRDTLTEALKFNINDITAGDILLVKSFVSDDNTIDAEHRVLITYCEPKNNRNKSMFAGFIMSSKVEKAATVNSKFPKNLLIDNYTDIIQTGYSDNKPIIIKLDTLATFTFADLKFGDKSYMGRVTPEFLKFISKVLKGEIDVTKVSYNKETAEQYL